MKGKQDPALEPAQGRPWMAPNIAMVTAMLFVLLALAFFLSQEPSEDRVLVPGWPGGGLEVKPWLEAHPMPADRAAYPVELTRSARSSVAIVQLRDSERLHVHQRHDLAVTLLRRSGTMRLGAQRRRVGPGDVVYIPAGTEHAFIKRNEKSAPAVALVVFTPPYDGKDMVQVEDKEASK